MWRGCRICTVSYTHLGMGLERLAVVVQDVDSIFDVDTLEHLRNEICKLAGIEYKQDPVSDISIRVITDHIRSVTTVSYTHLDVYKRQVLTLMRHM